MSSLQTLSRERVSIFADAKSALELKNYALASVLLGQLVADEPEFIVGRKLLRECQILRGRTAHAFTFRTMFGVWLSLGKSKAQRALAAGGAVGAMNEAEKALKTDPLGLQPNKDLHQAAEAIAKKKREEIAATLEPAFQNATDETKVEAARLLDVATDRMRAYEAIARFALETIALEPKNEKTARHDLGRYLMSIEEFEDANKLYEEILAENTADLFARVKAAEAAARRSGSKLNKTIAYLTMNRAEAGAGEKVVNASDSPEELARKIYEAAEPLSANHSSGPVNEEPCRIPRRFITSCLRELNDNCSPALECWHFKDLILREKHRIVPFGWLCGVAIVIALMLITAGYISLNSSLFPVPQIFAMALGIVIALMVCSIANSPPICDGSPCPSAGSRMPLYQGALAEDEQEDSMVNIEKESFDRIAAQLVARYGQQEINSHLIKRLGKLRKTRGGVPLFLGFALVASVSWALYMGAHGEAMGSGLALFIFGIFLGMPLGFHHYSRN